MKQTRLARSGLVLITLPVFFACAGSTEPGVDVCEYPDQISLPGTGLYPEGIAVGDGDALYVGGLATGEIFRASACGGTETFASGLRNVVGLRVDENRSWLWACNSDFSGENGPELVAFDLDTGAEQARHPLEGGAGFCNDIALDDGGNLYVTDSFEARILRLAAADVGSNAPAQTWSTHADYAVPANTFGLNGLAIDGNALYVVTYETGRLFRVALTETQPTVETIALNRDLQNADGLQRIGSGEFVVVEGVGRLSRIQIDGNSATVSSIREGFNVPTTVAVQGGNAWVVEGQLDHFMGIDARDPDPFRVVRSGLDEG